MMLVVSGVTAVTVIMAQRNIAASVKRELERQFQSELATIHAVQEMRHAALAERCRALARKPRIHAALEDNALDLLYPSAHDELRDVRESGNTDPTDASPQIFQARFYRFLDSRGTVIPTPATSEVGLLSSAEEARLALSVAPSRVQTGYLLSDAGTATETLDEIIAMPIISTESGAPIAALVLGFAQIAHLDGTANPTLMRGIWTNRHLHLPSLASPARAILAGELARRLDVSHPLGTSFPTEINRAPCLIFYLPINQNSSYPPAYEVGIYSLAESVARQRRLFSNSLRSALPCSSRRSSPVIFFPSNWQCRSNNSPWTPKKTARNVPAPKLPWNSRMKNCNVRRDSPPMRRISSRLPSPCSAPASKTCWREKP